MIFRVLFAITLGSLPVCFTYKARTEALVDLIAQDNWTSLPVDLEYPYILICLCNDDQNLNLFQGCASSEGFLISKSAPDT
jgi:hypothetical protein